MTDKVKKELEYISDLIYRLKQWETLNEEEVKALVREFNTIPREEWSSYRVELLRDSEVGSILLSIGEKYGTSADILKYVISSIGNLIVRYKLEPTDDLYNFFLAHKDNTKVGYYVSLFIFDFPQFESYKEKWDYILSIPGFAPRKDSANVFFRTIQKYSSEIPDTYLLDVISLLTNIAENAGEYTREKFIDLITMLKRTSKT